MSWIKERSPAEWRDKLVIASFRGEPFHVEQGVRSSGRRTVVHEYPKRNQPYSEDMGRHAVRYAFTAYLIHGDHLLGSVTARRNRLIRALEEDDAGMLIHPSLDGEYRELLMMCERYAYMEQRERGGYFEFDLQFVEAGAPALSDGFVDSAQSLSVASKAAESGGSLLLDSATAWMLHGNYNSRWP